MFISDFAIKKPLVTTVAMLALAVFGLFALLKLKTDEFPEVAPPYVSVGIVYPGASPDGVAKEILDPIEEPIASLALSSSALSQAELTRLADPTITRELRSIPGVAEVLVSGKVERELTVELIPARMQSAGVSVGQVVQALQLQNLAAPVGRVTGDLDERSIRLKGRLENVQEFAQLVVAERNGQLTRLGDVATVRDGTEEPRTLALFNDQEAVGLDIKKSKGFSTTDVSDQIRARVAQLQTSLPKGTK